MRLVPVDHVRDIPRVSCCPIFRVPAQLKEFRQEVFQPDDRLLQID
jgi:hypothetical protein